MKHLLAIGGLLWAMAGSAQTTLFNADWEFQRLNTEQSNKEIKNQGSDWSSQYDVQHLNVSQGMDGLSAELLNDERQQLGAGRWEKVSLPHTPFVEPLVVLHQWQGVCYYRRKFNVAAADLQKCVWLEFEGAMHLADLWVNGQYAARHAGGYTPFVTDVTQWLHAGENEVTVRLDNRNNPLVPPGKPLEDLDFSYYGGLYRDAHLIVKNRVHISHPIMAREVAGGGVFVTYPHVTVREAKVQVKTHVVNSLDADKRLTVRQTLYEWSKKGMAKQKVTMVETPLTVKANGAAYVRQNLTVAQPKLWFPDAPALYVVRTEVIDGGKVTDTEDTRIGIRRIEMSKEYGFVINGKPYKLEGTNRHQEYPYVGYALSDEAHYRDVWQIRNNGFNTVRLGHYPQDPAVLDACDELGLMAIEPIPGWQFFNAAEEFIENTYKDVRDLIRRDRNHPSIIMWETTLNESNPPKYWKDRAVQTAHEEYPGNQCFTSGDTYGYDGFDVCYNDWEEEFNRPNNTAKPSFIREYYDYEFGGHYSTTRIARGDGDRALVQNAWNAQWSHNRYRAYYPYTMGQAVWSMYDYNRGCCNNICYSGVADIFRLPKFSLHYFRLQTPAGSYTPAGSMPYELHINSHWMAGSSDTVMVYGNVDEVELELNGRSVARQKADRKPDTREYVSRPDGGNTAHVNFPPFTFFGVKWEAGELKAIGYKEGKKVAEQVVRTPGKPAMAEISYLEAGKKAAKHDVLLVYVSLKDDMGTLCFGENNREVTLEVAEGGRLQGPASVKTEAGIATFVVSTSDAKTLVLTCKTGELTQTQRIKLQ